MAGIGLHVDFTYMSLTKTISKTLHKDLKNNLDGQQQTELDEIYPD